MTDSVFLPEEDGSLPIRSAVFQALGAASACWDKDGVFESSRAQEIGEALMAEIDKVSDPKLREALNAGAAKNHELKGRVAFLEGLLARRTRALSATSEQASTFREGLVNALAAADVTRDHVDPKKVHDAVGFETILRATDIPLKWVTGVAQEWPELPIEELTSRTLGVRDVSEHVSYRDVKVDPEMIQALENLEGLRPLPRPLPGFDVTPTLDEIDQAINEWVNRR